MSIAIAGIPRSGKTTMAEELADDLGFEVLHSDALAGLGWSEASGKAAEWLDQPDAIVEGVAVIRALRKRLKAVEGAPCVRLYWLGETRTKLLPGQATMASGCVTVLEEIRGELEARGVEVVIVDGVIERWST